MTIGMLRLHAAPNSAHTYGRSKAQGVIKTTNSSALPRNFSICSSKSSPTSMLASSRKGTAPHLETCSAICLATHVSRALWLMKTVRLDFRDRFIATCTAPADHVEGRSVLVFRLLIRLDFTR